MLLSMQPAAQVATHFEIWVTVKLFEIRSRSRTLEAIVKVTQSVIAVELDSVCMYVCMYICMYVCPT